MKDGDSRHAARLAELRQRLDGIDAEIIDLIAERQAVVAEIGELKLEAHAPLRHFEREREVIERGMQRAEDLGLSGQVAREVLEALIRHSLGKQETDKWVHSGHGQGRQALVIGGLGRMGRWMAYFLDAVGYVVHVSDPAPGDSPFQRIDAWESTLPHYDLVVVAVPLRPSNAILMRLAELRPPGLVFDVASLKSPLLEGLRALRDAGCRVCSVHPMFGPNEIGLSGRHILFVDVGHPEAVAEARALFAHTAADCVSLSLDEHDEIMAWVLGLSHILNIAFAGTLASSGAAVPLLRRISSSTFNAQLRVAAQVVSENPHLYYEIQHGNQLTPRVIGNFQDVLQRLARAIAEGREADFTHFMELANHHLQASESPPVGA